MITALLARLGILYNLHKCVQKAIIVRMDNYPLVYRILGDLKFATDLAILGGAESKNRTCFCPSGQD